MAWVTLYITGKSDFREEVRRKLEHSDLKVMSGYTGGSFTSDIHDLYWLDEKTELRDLKEAIGSKLLWKHRLQFYLSLEAYIKSQNKEKNELTEEDWALIAEMQASSFR